MEISILFGISQSTVFDCFHDLCEALFIVRNRVICWPDPQCQQEISDHFETECKIPGITGIIDGSHITLSNIFLIEIKITLTAKGIPHSSYNLLSTTFYLLQIALLDGQDVPRFSKIPISTMS